ncbi:hypothetical protein HL658_09910 [Azospirillum sp. RWY-5-1]|uniref:Uncharacterized protein n=1 Tax=Azospirillum oleiclasticum TaxID=2735135 RepID=A0ABX2T6T2_9PROT|nr:hypothetical protein [Azospirillum oleiclasticum]NYZ12867.1 hypothetical protein [Azospirillum oleiclasticum]NYZ20027.1 hypothetical protein [Azospirillum oleiclasticum]
MALSPDEQAFIDGVIRRQQEWDRENPEKARLRGFLWHFLGLAGAAPTNETNGPRKA